MPNPHDEIRAMGLRSRIVSEGSDEACKEEAERCDNMQRLLTQRTREVVAAENHVQALLEWFDHPLTVGEAAEHVNEVQAAREWLGKSSEDVHREAAE